MESVMRSFLLSCMMAAGVAGCGGVAYVAEECTGPYCHVTCVNNSDCPSGSWCLLTSCTMGSGYEGGSVNGGADGIGVDGGSDSGDTGYLPNDGPVSSDGGGDMAAGDFLVGDPTEPADAMTTTGDGVVCWDQDLDGYCPPPWGEDCDDEDFYVNPGVLEICDGSDNNCVDGIDEGVKNACGNCQEYPLCNTDDPWSGGSGVDLGDLPPPTSGEDGTVLLDDDEDGYGSITLASGTVATDFAWPASQTQGTLSRIDTVANIEVARYATVAVRDDDPYRPYVADFGPTTQCQQPSRSTIDEFGNAYIANRACSGYGGSCPSWSTLPNANGSVTKVGFFHEVLCDPEQNPGLSGCQCVDRNGNGRIERSRDYNDPPNGISVPICSGSNCGTTCVEDADCGSGYCVRVRHPTQAQGNCSNAAPVIAPCTGDHCAQTCTRHSNCPTSHFCVRDNDSPTQRFCSDRPETPEFLGKDDECLLWTRRIPGRDDDAHTTVSNDNLLSRPRAMAVDKEGYIWVGDYDRSHVFKLTPDGEFVDPVADATPINQVCPRTARRVADGTVVATPATTCLSERCFFTIPQTCRVDVQLSPYGAVIDSGRSHPNGFGYLWIAARSGELQRIDTETGQVTAKYDNNEDSYGVTIDQHDRVWVADANDDADHRAAVHRFDPNHVDFDPASSVCPACWTKFLVDAPASAPWSGINWKGRGITTELLGDNTARIWAIFNNDWWGTPNYLVAFDADTGQEITGHRVRLDNSSITPVSGPGCTAPAGVGIGYGGMVWSVNRDTSSVCAYDPANPFNALISVSMGPSPYTYSDFTGNLFRSFTKPQGFYRMLVQACPANYEVRQWGTVSWTAEVPGASSLEVRFRVGSSVAEAISPATVQYGPAIQPIEISFDLGLTRGDWLQVEFLFVADDEGLAPTLHHVDIARECKPIGE
ncbi:MAG: hypothetical protein A2289_16740 [Deltaproteobacteria bacterium RIFOXYA12_FULL_58_15]|nr:MAG: hypothetical protein A2289_16740 [Deltaproteobacteria bacterium RIFOXYA12_FULL_58_15]